jgi:ribosome-associated protein
MSTDLIVQQGIVIPASDLSWTASRASGPGGQNVNKVASKVELRFALARCTALDAAVKARLQVLAASRLDAEGSLLITSQVTRDQPRNLEDARQKLAELVRRACFVPKLRRATRPTRSSKVRRIADKRKDGEKKQTRSRVRGDD